MVLIEDAGKLKNDWFENKNTIRGGDYLLSPCEGWDVLIWDYFWKGTTYFILYRIKTLKLSDCPLSNQNFTIYEITALEHSLEWKYVDVWTCVVLVYFVVIHAQLSDIVFVNTMSQTYETSKSVIMYCKRTCFGTIKF